MRLHLGEVMVDLERGRYNGPDREGRLSELECRLLRHLAEAQGQPIMRGVLLERVWGYRATMETRTVDVAMARLRSKLERDPGDPEHLLTVRGEGYRMRRHAEAHAERRVAAPPAVGPCVGREAAVVELVERLQQRPVGLVGLPGMGATTLAAAVARAWPGPVAWVEVGEDVLASFAAAFGCAADPLLVLRQFELFEGLVVIDGRRDAALPDLPSRAGVLSTIARPGLAWPIPRLSPADAEAAFRAHVPRALRPDEDGAVPAVVAAAAGAPGVLAQLARALRFEDAHAVAARVAGGAPIPEAWLEARGRLDPREREAADVLGWFRDDFAYGAAAAVVAPERLDALVESGWISTRWSARGELRLVAPAAASAGPPAGLGVWLAGLTQAGLAREAGLALRYVEVADAPRSVLLGLHEVCRVSGGWDRYRAALERLVDPDPDLRYARAEARWQTGDGARALEDFDRVIAVAPTGERLALRAFYRSRLGDAAGARADLAAVGEEEGPGLVEAWLMAALFDSEAGDPEAAEPRLRAALGAAERFGRPRQVARARFYLGTAQLHRGDGAAVGTLERAVGDLRALDAEVSASLGETVLAWAYVEAGDRQRGERVLTEAVQRLEAGGLVAPAAAGRRALAVFRLTAGGSVDLRPLLVAPPPGELGAVRAMLAWVEARGGRRDEAERHAELARATLGLGGEIASITEAWLHAAGLGPAPTGPWVRVSPEVRVVGRSGGRAG